MPAPSVTSLLRQGLRYFYGESQFRDFSGGWNIRDAQGELAANESPDLYNVTLDERGGISKRLGYTKYNSSAFGSSLVTNCFYWSTGQNLITQAGTKLYKDTSTTEFKTFTTSERCGFADFTGLLYFIHPTDGLFSYDGTTVTARAAGPKGTTLAPWQNKLWAAGDPLNKPRVYFSAAGDGTSWPGTNFVDLREKDTEIVTCLAGASGLDISGRAGLLAFKRRSTYRIFDSSTGQFQTLDTQIGAASSISVVNGFQRTVALGESGIYWTDGVGPMRPASDKIVTLFDPTQIAFSQLDKFSAGIKGDRMYFSLPRAGATANNLELEHHPLQGWIVASSSAASCYATYGKDDQIMYAGSPSVVGQVYRRLTGGSDDGTAITSRFQGRWAEPTGGHQVRINRARVTGRGSFTLDVFTDYQLSPSLSLTVNLSGSAAIYDDAGSVYDQAGVLYGPLKYQDFKDFPQLGVMRAISLRFSETSSASTTGLPILGTGAAPEVGAYGAYGINLSYVPLGIG
jgi:hypothetical protein